MAFWQLVLEETPYRTAAAKTALCKGPSSPQGIVSDCTYPHMVYIRPYLFYRSPVPPAPHHSDSTGPDLECLRGMDAGTAANPSSTSKSAASRPLHPEIYHRDCANPPISCALNQSISTAAEVASGPSREESHRYAPSYHQAPSPSYHGSAVDIAKLSRTPACKRQPSVRDLPFLAS